MVDPYTHTAGLPTAVEIIPAILPKRFRDLEQHLGIIHAATKRVQVDVVDGVFAGSKTWPYTDRTEFDKIIAEEHGLPFWGDLDFEFDLMLANPLEDVRDFVRAGASRIVLHAHSEQALAAFQSLVDVRDDSTGSLSITVGVAVLPTDQPDLLESFEAQFDFIQVMGVDRVGKQGQPFNPHTVFLVERLRRRYPQLPLQVDGGVTLENAQSLVHAGANRLIVGSAIFGAKDPLASLAALRDAVR